LLLAEQFWQLGNVAGNPSRFVLAEQLGGGRVALCELFLSYVCDHCLQGF
jgi:hypothetical protein